MPRFSNGQMLLILVGFFAAIAYGLLLGNWMNPAMTSAQLLTDPFLQAPTQNSVQVVWFTEFLGTDHRVVYGAEMNQEAFATTMALSRVREDGRSRVGAQTEDNQIYTQPVSRNIWRHEATVSNLTPGERVSYHVISVSPEGASVQSRDFTLAATPLPGRSLNILLTSDHQQMPMTPANLQKVVETVGQVDAVFLAGDLVNIPDRASEWFDDNRGHAFFPCLQGRAAYDLEREGTVTRYTGGEIIQQAPLFPATGNHEVMGRFSNEAGLNDQYNDPHPLAIAQRFYDELATQINPNNDPQVQADWIKNHSFNVDTFNEIFTIPTQNSGTENYYAVTFGDVRLVSLYATNIWRTPSLNSNAKGRYRERDEDLDDQTQWGYGQHIFEAIAPGSPQYSWLVNELSSPAFQQAKYKVVMLHHPPHSLGDNIVPAYTDPRQIVHLFPDGTLKAVRYEYPQDDDYLIRDIMPVLEAAGTQLVFYGHSHLWNRFTSPDGMHFLESSNIGNTYGAFLGNKRRAIPIGFKETYAAFDDPNGLAPIVPTLAPLLDDTEQPLPFLSSNDITAFSILNTETGTVSSYRFDTRQPDSPAVKFDEFSLVRD